VINLEVTQHRGEVHVKAGYLLNGPYYTVKIASGFLDNPQLGLPSSDGTVLVFDARTGALAALLLDNGYITDLRTGVAGAISAKHLARARAETIAVVGSGAQARCQIRSLALVREFRSQNLGARSGKSRCLHRRSRA